MMPVDDIKKLLYENRHKFESYHDQMACISPEKLAALISELVASLSSESPAPQKFQEWVVEQEGNERILRRYYQSQHLMKRDVAIFCDWNGPEDVEADKKRVMELLAPQPSGDSTQPH